MSFCGKIISIQRTAEELDKGTQVEASGLTFWRRRFATRALEAAPKNENCRSSRSRASKRASERTEELGRGENDTMKFECTTLAEHNAANECLLSAIFMARLSRSLLC